MISRENYEIWFLDYLEGKLSSKEQSVLYQFLSKNPDLNDELDSMKEGFYEIEYDVPYTENLKKNIIAVAAITELNYENYFLASVEGDLSLKEIDHLNAFLAQNPFLIPELDYLGKTHVSHSGETLPNKRRLKHEPMLIPLFRYSAAASVLVLLGVGITHYVFFSRNEGLAALPHVPYVNLDINSAIVSKTQEQSVVQNFPSVIEKEQTYTELAEREFHPIMNMTALGSEKFGNHDFIPDYAISNQLPKIVEPNQEETLSIGQVIGKVIENGIGENAVSESLEKEDKITGGDVAEFVAAPFKKSETPVMAVGNADNSGKRKVRFNFGVFETEFALK